MPSSSPGPSLLDASASALEKAGWKFQRIEGKDVLEAMFEAHHSKVRLHVQVFPEIRTVTVVATSSHTIPDSRTGLVSELLMRANQQLTLGNFEMDWDRGTVLFRFSNVFSPDRFDPNILASMVHSAIAETDRMTPFLSIILKMAPDDLATLNLKLFLMREDLLPPVPEVPEEEGSCPK